MYLKIENQGVAPVEGFTVFGVSTSRGDESKLGQFGSGAKHAIMQLLRSGISPIIMLGKERLEFYAEPIFVNGQQFNEVRYKFRKETHKLSYTLEFGELDWDSTAMALREIISNAIDAGGYKVSTCELPTFKSDCTTIFIPMTPEIQKYSLNLSTYFLHFVGKEKETLLPKKDKSPPKIYRKGVFVRQLESSHPGLFDYNFGDELKIDECRNLDDTRGYRMIGTLWQNNTQYIKAVLRAFRDNMQFAEMEIPNWMIYNHPDLESIYKEVCGNAYASNRIAASHLHKQGHDYCIFSDSYYQEISRIPIPTYLDVLSACDKRGVVEVPTILSTVTLVNRICGIIEKHSMDANKCRPLVGNFRKPHSDIVLQGYCDFQASKVWISADCPTDIPTIVEELAHWYSDSIDLSQGMQSWLVQFSAILVGEKL